MHVSTDFADALFFAQHVCHCRVGLAAEEQLLTRWRCGHPARTHPGVNTSIAHLRPAAPLTAIGWRERGSVDFSILLADHPAVADDRAVQAHLARALTTMAYWLVVLPTSEQEAMQICILDTGDAGDALGVGGEPVCIEQRPCPGLLPRHHSSSCS
jgi:hypothetical protein